jgi:Fic family protein
VEITRFEASPMGDVVPIRGVDAFLNRPYSHFAFVPAPLSRELAMSARSIKLLSEAERALGRLDAASCRLPNPQLLVRPTLYREAVSTSALEGTYALFQDVLESDFVDEVSRSREVREVRNYVRAAALGLELIEKKPICVSILKQLQAVLVEGTRGDSYDAGSLRAAQVYLGERHRGIEASRFVPPPPGEALVEGMSDWEKWLNAEDDLPLLVKAALGHYQFETLHPFSDGNGRLGRLVVVLQLIYNGALKYPILNISPWLEERKDEYKDHLLQLSQTGNFDPWLQFFFEAVRHQAEDAVSRIERIVEIRNRMREQLRQVKARGVVLEIVDDLIGYPVITVSQAAELHDVTFPPANSAIQRLVDLGYLTEITGGGYKRIFVCREIMAAVENPNP